MRLFVGLLIALSPLLVGCASVNVSCPVNTGPPPRPICSVPEPDPPPENPYRPQNLVFQGGGVKGIAYGGALRVLEQERILEGVKRVAGTSAGAITSTLVALGYTPREITNLMFTIDFSRLEDGGAGGIFRIFRRYGFYRGRYFLNLMRCLVKQKTGDEHSTFSDLANSGEKKFLDLRLFTTDLNTGDIRELSNETTPDLEVALAARMSMSIPLFFAAVEPEGLSSDDHLNGRVLVDGGVLNNYPIRTFDEKSDDKKTDRSQTLGFVLFDTAPQKHARIESLLSYSRALVNTLLNVQVAQLQIDRPNLARTAVLDDLGVPTTDFQLTDETKRKLLKSGADCTCRYLERRQEHDAELLLVTPLPPGTLVPLSNFKKCGWVLDGDVGEVRLAPSGGVVP